jgi:cob(I)alamin adenosyltransferase
MVALNKIYTRTGDDGTTGLVGTERRSKADARIEAIGAVDEVNAALGMARLHVGALPAIDAMLARVQNDLFDLGADLATVQDESNSGKTALRLTDEQVARLETEIDELNAALSPLESFVLPGGSPVAAGLHFARTLTRRAERAVVRLAETPGESVNAAGSRYLNRLSDLLFVMARWCNQLGADDVLWQPGKHR